jgi:hypothetical protein
MFSARDPSRSRFEWLRQRRRRRPFGALTLEIGTNIKALIQKGSFGAEIRYEI